MATKKKAVKKDRGINYTHYIPAKLDTDGRVEYYAAEEYVGEVHEGGMRIPVNMRERNPKFAKFFWSPNDAKAFCTLAGHKWVVIERKIAYKEV